MIEPPSYLPPRAIPAWNRVVQRVAANGWQDIYESGCAVIAMQCMSYLDCCKLHGPDAPVTKETHEITRLWMSDFGLVDSVVRIRYDDLGRDVEILELFA